VGVDSRCWQGSALDANKLQKFAAPATMSTVVMVAPVVTAVVSTVVAPVGVPVATMGVTIPATLVGRGSSSGGRDGTCGLGVGSSGVHSCCCRKELGV
jgi:hypothetical protein